MSINVTARGNLAADPRFFEASGDMQAMASFPLASSRRVRGEDLFDGFFDVAVYGAQAKTIAETLKKGSRVLVEGRLKQSKRKDDSYHVGIVAYAVANSLEFAHREAGADRFDVGALAAAAGPARDKQGRFVAAG